MTLVRFNQRPIDRKFNSFFEDLFNQFPSRMMADEAGMTNSVPVNIRETEKTFTIEVVAPGMDKADFKVNVDNNILTISGEKKNETNQESERLVRREYSYKSFARTFTLDESIQSEDIQARYENGVLRIELPKKEEQKIQPKQINIE
jgi:HSP20 family protein